jgi:pyruvate/2-oxoglutarate dehydrogenase complex dihydrolipoamide dehydrogenase (E3) component
MKVVGKAPRQRRVAVVGAGPAGMEAARVAAARGHKVVLVEEATRIGGTLNAGCLPPCKEKLGSLVNWYKKQLEDLKVEVRLGRAWSAEMASEIQPEAVVVATGSKYRRPMPGNERAITATEALLHPEKIGNDVVIVGGGSTGCEVAEYVAGDRVAVSLSRVKDFSGELVFEQRVITPESKKRVTIIEMSSGICYDMYGQSAAVMRLKLICNDVKLLVSSEALSIGDGLVRVQDTTAGKISELHFDTVILATGVEANRVDACVSRECDVFDVGDCSVPGRIIGAINSGYFVANRI